MIKKNAVQQAPSIDEEFFNMPLEVVVEVPNRALGLVRRTPPFGFHHPLNPLPWSRGKLFDPPPRNWKWLAVGKMVLGGPKLGFDRGLCFCNKTLNRNSLGGQGQKGLLNISKSIFGFCRAGFGFEVGQSLILPFKLIFVTQLFVIWKGNIDSMPENVTLDFWWWSVKKAEPFFVGHTLLSFEKKLNSWCQKKELPPLRNPEDDERFETLFHFLCFFAKWQTNATSYFHLPKDLISVDIFFLKRRIEMKCLPTILHLEWVTHQNGLSVCPGTGINQLILFQTFSLCLFNALLMILLQQEDTGWGSQASEKNLLFLKCQPQPLGLGSKSSSGVWRHTFLECEMELVLVKKPSEII